MIDEGYIKYRCNWVKADAVTPASVRDLTCYRDALHQLHLIGEYPNGIGFGNISQRLPPLPLSPLSPLSPFPLSLPKETRTLPSTTAIAPPKFIISGTQTGNLPTLTPADYALVTDFTPEQNSLTCQGLRKASSESLTHGVIYASQPAIGAIIHVHNRHLWEQLLNQVPTTRADVPYGTPDMAKETQRLFRESGLANLKIFAMAGHEDGIVTFGETLQIAYRVLINWSLTTGLFTQPASVAALQLPYRLASPTSDNPVGKLKDKASGSIK